jgi:hypothetical protein
MKTMDEYHGLLATQAGKSARKKVATKLKDRKKRSEEGEWKSIKIPHKNLPYISKSIRCPLSSNLVKTV